MLSCDVTEHRTSGDPAHRPRSLASRAVALALVLCLLPALALGAPKKKGKTRPPAKTSKSAKTGKGTKTAKPAAPAEAPAASAPVEPAGPPAPAASPAELPSLERPAAAAGAVPAPGAESTGAASSSPPATSGSPAPAPQRSAPVATPAPAGGYVAPPMPAPTPARPVPAEPASPLAPVLSALSPGADRASRLRWAGGALLAGGLVSGIAAGVTSWQMLDAQARVQGAPVDATGTVIGLTQKDAAALDAKARGLFVASACLWGAAGVLTVSGAVLAVLGAPPDAVVLAPAPGGLSVAGTF